MNTNRYLTVMGILLLTGLRSWSNETNTYTTLGPFDQPPSVPAQSVTLSNRPEESLPASQDPEGNWGKASEGLQLSIRFEKDSFKSGEPIVGSVLVRNTSDKSLWYFDFYGAGADSVVCEFIVLDVEKQVVSRSQTNRWLNVKDGRNMRIEVHAGTQRKYPIGIDQRFKMNTPGKYFIQAKKRVPKAGGDGFADITSGEAVITILP